VPWGDPDGPDANSLLWEFFKDREQEERRREKKKRKGKV
jgi:hypothetical protein